MEVITQEMVDKIVNNWGAFKTSIEKIDDLILDMNNCKSEYTKSILANAVSKLSDPIGIKEKIFNG